MYMILSGCVIWTADVWGEGLFKGSHFFVLATPKKDHTLW